MMAASIDSSKSMVPTTRERDASSATYGVVSSRASAHLYSVDEDWVVRLTMPSSPPLLFIHLTWSASMSKDATAGVLYVWFLLELSTAVCSSINDWMTRTDSLH